MTFVYPATTRRTRWSARLVHHSAGRNPQLESFDPARPAETDRCRGELRL